MFSKSKDSPFAGDQDQPPAAMKAAVPPMPPVQPAQQRPVAQPTAATVPGVTTSVIGAGMTVVGKLSGEGAVNIFGHFEGDLHVSSAVIGDGAQLEGSIVAKDLTIAGRVKGTIHAARVKLHGSAVVEGDIFHRSLSIEENARFEGLSRREESVNDRPVASQPRSPMPLPQAQPQAHPQAHPQNQSQVGPMDGNSLHMGTRQ